MKQLLKFSIIALICMIMCAICSCRPKAQKDIVVNDSDSIVQYVPTVHEVLQEREYFKHIAFVDSCYLHLPDAILINILTKIGTTAEIEEVINEYVKNKSLYDEAYKQILIYNKYNAPDSLPKESIPNIPIDSVKQAIRISHIK